LFEGISLPQLLETAVAFLDMDFPDEFHGDQPVTNEQ